jgi:PAS domain S-box-containing protein
LPDRHLWVLRDVSKARRMEHDLSESNEMLRALVEASPTAIDVVDAQGVVRLWNPAAAQLFGWQASEVIGKRLPTVDERAFAALLEEVTAGSSFAAFPVERRHRDGHAVALSLSRAPIRNRRGRIVGSVSMQVDLTEQRKLEEQVLQAQKMDAIGRLAGGIAHDFNNMLGAILGFASALQEELPVPSPMARDAEQIVLAAERAAQLTRQLLAFSRKQVLQPSVFDLGRLVRDLEPMLRRLLGEHIELAVKTAGGPARIKADPTQIEQIVLNLVINARDAMPRGGRLTVAVGRRFVDDEEPADPFGARRGDYGLLRVSDSGTGMDPSTQARIFEPFFTTKPKGKGTGLGLSTVYGVVKQSGGHIRVESVLGTGTAFEILLPSTEEPLPRALPLRSLGARSCGGGETVLVVEDDATLRALICRSLVRSGFDVLEAEDGAAALALSAATSRTIHLLLTDLVMPHVGGLDLAEQLRVDRPETTVLYMSGYADQTDELPLAICKEGAALLTKPFMPATLVELVRQMLDDQHGQSVAAPASMP